MSDAALKSRHGVILRAASGDLTAVDRPLPLTDLQGYRRAVVHIIQEANLATPDVDDEVKFYLDTAYGEGAFAASGELLDGGIDPTQTAVTVDDASTFVVGDVLQVDNEFMLVTATDGAAPGVLTVRRGQRGSVGASHDDDSVVRLLDVGWVAVANVTYATADNGTAPQAVVSVGNPALTPVIVDDLDGEVADDTIRALPLGDRLRLRTTVAGATAPTYNYSARVSLQN